jgi:hypothetical protein
VLRLSTRARGRATSDSYHRSLTTVIQESQPHRRGIVRCTTAANTVGGKRLRESGGA